MRCPTTYSLATDALLIRSGNRASKGRGTTHAARRTRAADRTAAGPHRLARGHARPPAIPRRRTRSRRELRRRLFHQGAPAPPPTPPSPVLSLTINHHHRRRLHTEHGFAARAHDQPLGGRGAAPRGGACSAAAGRGARGPRGRRGDGAVCGRAPDDGAELVEACDDRGHLGGHHQLPDRHQLSRGQRAAHAHP